MFSYVVIWLLQTEVQSIEKEKHHLLWDGGVFVWLQIRLKRPSTVFL